MITALLVLGLRSRDTLRASTVKTAPVSDGQCDGGGVGTPSLSHLSSVPVEPCVSWLVRWEAKACISPRKREYETRLRKMTLQGDDLVIAPRYPGRWIPRLRTTTMIQWYLRRAIDGSVILRGPEWKTGACRQGGSGLATGGRRGRRWWNPNRESCVGLVALELAKMDQEYVSRSESRKLAPNRRLGYSTI